MTAAAIALRLTSPVPAWMLAEASLADEKTPPSAAKVEHSTKAVIRIESTLIPDRLAASALPPIANIERPHFVRVRAYSAHITTNVNMANIHGTPRPFSR